MLHRILDQRLNGKQGDGYAQSGWVGVHFGVQLGAEAQLLDLQIGAHDAQLLFDFHQGALGAQQVAIDIRQIQDQPAGLHVAAIDGAVERVQGVEQKVRVDLRLQGLQLRLRDKVLHLDVTELFDMLGDGGSQARQHGEVFAEIAPSAAARAEQEIGCVAARKAHGEHCLYPCRDGEVRRIEHRYRRRGRAADGGVLLRQIVARGMQETGDGLGGQARVFRLRAGGERQILQFAERLIHVGTQENGASEQALDAIMRPDKQRQQQAGGDEDHSGVERVPQMLGENARLQNADRRQQSGGRQRGVHDEAQKRVHEQEAIIL